jgi:dolichyl-phosphate-mannose-protein mannosyltransferase
MSEIAVPRAQSSARSSAIAIAIGIAAVIALRLAILFRFRIDSDETQHLHVVWGWSHGLVQYRDLFDNHMPLFQLLSVPLLRFAGERAEALIAGRLAMLPLFALIVVLTYRIAARLYPPRIALFATILGCSAPVFFLCSVEFRPDVLWAVFWLASIAIFVGGERTTLRCAASGLMLGLAAAVSAKTAMLAFSFAIAAIATSRGFSLKRTAAFIGAALLPLAAIAAFFARIGAWNAFLHGTLGHNLVTHEHPHRILFLIPASALIVFAARRIPRDARLFVFLAASVYGTVLISLWPIIEREHWLPFYPAAAAGIIPLLLRPQWQRIAIAVLAIDVLRIVITAAPWKDEVRPTTEMIAQTLRLTRPDERVVDLKGDFVFRRRASRLVFEKITKKAIARGQLPDTIADDVKRTHAMVAVLDDPSFPKNGRAFLQRNFIRVGDIRVAGMIVNRTFRIELPGEYSVVSASGTVSAPSFLGEGTHTIAPAGAGPYAVIWSRAAAMGLSPF